MPLQCTCPIYVILVLVVPVFVAAWSLGGSSEFAVAGESFTLTCNPQDSTVIGVKWKRLDIDTIATGTSRATVSSNGCKIGSGSDTQYQYTCGSGHVYELTIPANVMTNGLNNKVWRCENILGGASAEYTITVAVPVISVSIHTDNNQKVNVIYDNIPKTFYCITNGCRPKANVTVTTTGVTKGQLTDSTTQNGDLIITRLSQVITANRGGSAAKTLQCLAVNIPGRQQVTSQLVTFDVYYKPSVEPTLTGYTDGKILYDGDSDVTLICQQSGGYPLSVITWSCEGRRGTTNNSQTVASSYVQLTVNKNLNRKMCTCNVHHPDNNLAYTRTLSVTFTVYYPPTTPTLSTLRTNFPWVENTQGVLRCTTAPGNPQQTTYDWLQNSTIINGQTTDTFTIPALTNVHNGLRIQCRASNEYTRKRPPAKVSNVLTLHVQYTPIITLDTTNITVQEGDNLSRQCSAIGNPTPTVNWYRGTSKQTSGTGISATLVFSNIDRNQTDIYECKAAADGKQNFESSRSVSVVVYYPPAVTVNLQNTTENATNVVFTCNADGFPTNYTYHGWTQYIGNTIVRSYTDFTGMLSDSNRKLTIHKVSFKDIGRYHCVMDNGIKGRQTNVSQQGSSYFDVRASAKFDPKEEARKPGELHKNLTVNVKFYSNPPAVNSGIKWINKTSNNTLMNLDSISLKLMSTAMQIILYGKNVALNGQTAMLTIVSLQSFHLGHYELQIKNGGNMSSSFDFQIITSEPPETPSEFSLAENGTESVILTWKRGFNGGHTQTFVIRYTNTFTHETKETTKEDNNLNSNYTIEINGLEPSTTYHFWIYSTNEKGNSTLSGNLIVQTLKELEPGRPTGNIGTIAGGITGTLVAIIIIGVIVGVIFYRRRTRGTKKNDSRQNGKFPLTARDQSDEEDGLRDNVLYEPAGPNFVKPGGASAGISVGATGGQNDYPYAEVQKNGKNGLDNPVPVYAEVQKNPKKDKKPDPSAVYADVQKPKIKDKEGKGGTKPKKFLGKPKEKKGKSAKTVTEDGTLYENMDDINAQKKEDERKKPKASKNKTKPIKNKDGLIYADILHESKPNGESRLVIHGLENKTDYAEVDFSRSGKPLPPDNSQTEKQETANK